MSTNERGLLVQRLIYELNQTRYIHRFYGYFTLESDASDKHELNRLIQVIERNIHHSTNVLYQRVRQQKKHQHPLEPVLQNTPGIHRNISISVQDVLSLNERSGVNSLISDNIQRTFPKVSVAHIGLNPGDVIDKVLNNTTPHENIFLFSVSYLHNAPNFLSDVRVVDIDTVQENITHS